MFKYLQSKNGFTLVEIMITVVVLGVLAGVAIPIYTVSVNNQRKADCKNNCMLVSADVSMVMTGMEDNGPKIIAMNVTGADGSDANGPYWVLSAQGPTIGEMRVGKTREDIKNNAAASSHLHKTSKDTVTLASLLEYGELPVCPFSSEDEVYEYRIYGDGSVRCSCPKCA